MHSNKQAVTVRAARPWDLALQAIRGHIPISIKMESSMPDLPITGPIQLAYFWFKNRK